MTICKGNVLGTLFFLFASCFCISANIERDATDMLEELIQSAEPHETVFLNPNEDHLVTRTIIINKPITLKGLRAHLPAGLGYTPILEVKAEGVILEQLHLRGNADSVDQDQRAPLIDVHGGNIRIENCVFENSSKDGIQVNTRPGEKELVGVVIRDIVGRGVVRDVVSIGSDDRGGGKVRNVLIENIRGYDSRLRGVVEISDGTENATVRTVYAERCVYAVDVQDHNHPNHVNRHVLIEDVYAKDCKHALRTANRPLGHTDLTIRNLTAERCSQSLLVKNTERVLIENVRLLQPKTAERSIHIESCKDVILRSFITDSSVKNEEELVFLKDCENVTADIKNP
ncbi:MAG: hypothetical protein AB3N63_04775 [Puniceicoccaceae bacterium]